MSEEHHFEFKYLKPDGYFVSASGILGVGNPVRVDLDPNASAESIFDLVPETAIPRGHFDIDMGSDHIKLRVNPEDKAEIERWRAQGSFGIGQAALFLDFTYTQSRRQSVIYMSLRNTIGSPY